MENKILILSKDETLAGEVAQCMPEAGYELVLSEGEDGVPKADVVILDVDTVSIGGLSSLAKGRFVIIVTARRGARFLIESMTFGAFDCLFRPLGSSNLRATLERAFGIRSELAGDRIGFPTDAEGATFACAIVGNSPMLQEVCKLVGSVGRVDMPVLITGESGTGKDLVAQSIWNVSTRWEKPFVVLNCAAIPETLLEAELFGYEKGSFTGADSAKRGKFEEADGGIIFLDEIGDMSLALQAKLLRVLQNGSFHRIGENMERKVDIRVIAATNKDLAELVRVGLFREDLLFRINVVNIHLPALRERKEDVDLLVGCFIRRHGAKAGKEIKGVTPDFIEKLMGHEWPGNIRELENVVRKAIVFSKTTYLTSYDLDISSEIVTVEKAASPSPYEPLRDSIRAFFKGEHNGGGVYGEVMKTTERALLQEALEASGWNRSGAARMLGINRLTLRKKIAEYGLAPD